MTVRHAVIKIRDTGENAIAEHPRAPKKDGPRNLRSPGGTQDGARANKAWESAPAETGATSAIEFQGRSSDSEAVIPGNSERPCLGPMDLEVGLEGDAVAAIVQLPQKAAGLASDIGVIH